MSRADKFRNGVARRSQILPPRPKPEPAVIPGGLLRVPAAREPKP
jgi:hypothetical protein